MTNIVTYTHSGGYEDVTTRGVMEMTTFKKVYEVSRDEEIMLTMTRNLPDYESWFRGARPVDTPAEKLAAYCHPPITKVEMGIK